MILRKILNDWLKQYLSSCGNVKLLNEVKQDSQWDNDCNKVDIGVANDDDGAEHSQKLAN